MTKEAEEQPVSTKATSTAGRNVLVLIVTILVVFVAVWFVSPSKSDASSQSGQIELEDPAAAAPKVGEAAPAFTARSLDGETVSVGGEKSGSTDENLPVWLIFNATWCANCRAEMPDIEKLQQEIGDKVQIIGVYLNDSPSQVLEYSHQLGLTFPQIPDPEGKIGALYRALGVPAHYFIDSDGTIDSVYVGALSEAAMKERLNEIRD